MNKEEVISKLKEQINVLETMKNEIQINIDSIGKTAATLQDESKLGTSAFDFGKDEQKKIVKAVQKKMLKGIAALKTNQKVLEEIQKAGESFTASIGEDNVEKT